MAADLFECQLCHELVRIDRMVELPDRREACETCADDVERGERE